jgi:hydrogenase small subunit
MTRPAGLRQKKQDVEVSKFENLHIFILQYVLSNPTTYMEDQRPTIYEEIVSKGISRRDFLKFCTTMAAFLGIEASGVGEIIKAFETKPRPAVIWLNLQECTCCTESFVRAGHPIIANILLDQISLDYSETLMVPSGFQADEVLKSTMSKYKGEYLLLIEGSIPTGNEAYCTIGGKSALSLIREAAKDAKAVVAWGNCAYAGCVQAASPNPTGAKPVHSVISGVPVINVPGCPPIADVMAGVIVYLLTFGRIPELDNMGRPKSAYSRRVHDTCYRRPNFDAGLFVKEFDDEGARQGYCLYKMGCRGPVTYNSCGIIRWNEGVSYPIQAGHGCIGCSEAGFWDHGPFYRHLEEVSGFGIESTADKIGMVLAAGTAAGVAGHAILTNIRKRKEIRNKETIHSDNNENQ